MSVLLCVHNGAAFLRASVDSILKQTLEDFELIVVDDGSTDGTRNVIASFRDPRIIVILQERRGLTASLNRALGSARGAFIARQDADDLSEPERLRRQAEFLDTHPDCALVGSSVIEVDERGREVGMRRFSSSHDALVRHLHIRSNPLPHTTLMMRASALAELGGYREFFRKAQDFDLLLRISERFRIASLPEPLVRLRRRADSLTMEDDSAEQWSYALLALVMARVRTERQIDMLSLDVFDAFLGDFRSWFEASGIRDRYLSSRSRALARRHFHEGLYGPAFRAVLRSIGQDPRWPLRRLLKEHVISPKETEAALTLARRHLPHAA